MQCLISGPQHTNLVWVCFISSTVHRVAENWTSMKWEMWSTISCIVSCHFLHPQVTDWVSSLEDSPLVPFMWGSCSAWFPCLGSSNLDGPGTHSVSHDWSDWHTPEAESKPFTLHIWQKNLPNWPRWQVNSLCIGLSQRRAAMNVIMSTQSLVTQSHAQIPESYKIARFEKVKLLDGHRSCNVLKLSHDLVQYLQWRCKIWCAQKMNVVLLLR